MAEHFEYQLSRAFAQKRKSLEEAVTDGSATDFAQYKYLVGQIYGITYCMQVLEEMRTKALEEDEG